MRPHRSVIAVRGSVTAHAREWTVLYPPRGAPSVPEAHLGGYARSVQRGMTGERESFLVTGRRGAPALSLPPAAPVKYAPPRSTSSSGLCSRRVVVRSSRLLVSASGLWC